MTACVAPTVVKQAWMKQVASTGTDLRAMDQPDQQRVVVTLRPVKVNAWPATH